MNQANQRWAEERQRFIDDLGNFIGSYGLGHSVGRVWAHLLLAPDPVSLDQIAADLGISKSGASTSARMLHAWGMARRITERGSRRIRYEPIVSFERLISASLTQMHAFLQMLDEGAQAAAPEVAARLQDLSSGYRLYLEAVEQALQRSKELARP